MSALFYRERAAEGEPAGLLILHHGRGTDELDLLPLAEVLDPAHRLLVVTPRAPLRLPGSPGYHWYVVPRVGYPDPVTFREAYDELAELHDELRHRTGLAPTQTVLGGFSMGSVMSYALALGEGRPAPAWILAFSGFIPTVAGWQEELAGRELVRAFIAHGGHDPVIDVAFARGARERLETAGLRVDYHESGGGHEIDPAHIPMAASWLAETLGV
jgi:phospholipase/carboxylesterase